MSEPTYRVELTHHPENGPDVEWQAAVYLAATYTGGAPFDLTVHDVFRATQQDAFDVARAWCKAKAQEPKAPRTVMLSEDGDILDPHEVQR